jgi:hypothetical protein
MHSTSPSSGFQLPSWRKLSHTKTNSGETIEQYIVKKLLSVAPEALQLQGDFPSLDEGRQVQLVRLKNDLKKLSESITLLEELLSIEESASPEGAVAEKLKKHISEMSRMRDRAKESVTAAESDFHELCRYFGYTSAVNNNASTSTGPTSTTTSASTVIEVTIEPEAFFVEIKDLCRSLSEAAQIAQNQSKGRRKAIRS